MCWNLLFWSVVLYLWAIILDITSGTFCGDGEAFTEYWSKCGVLKRKI